MGDPGHELAQHRHFLGLDQVELGALELVEGLFQRPLLVLQGGEQLCLMQGYAQVLSQRAEQFDVLGHPDPVSVALVQRDGPHQLVPYQNGEDRERLYAIHLKPLLLAQLWRTVVHVIQNKRVERLIGAELEDLPLEVGIVVLQALDARNMVVVETRLDGKLRGRSALGFQGHLRVARIIGMRQRSRLEVANKAAADACHFANFGHGGAKDHVDIQRLADGAGELVNQKAAAGLCLRLQVELGVFDGHGKLGGDFGQQFLLVLGKALALSRSQGYQPDHDAFINQRHHDGGDRLVLEELRGLQVGLRVAGGHGVAQDTVNDRLVARIGVVLAGNLQLSLVRDAHQNLDAVLGVVQDDDHRLAVGDMAL